MGVAGASPVPEAGSRKDLTAIRVGEDRPWRIAAVFLVPLFLLCALWAISNPPGAAPDESDHLVKAIGTAGFSIGTPGEPAPKDAPNVIQRNASITRVFSIPSNLNPTGYVCFAFQPKVSASCLPKAAPVAKGDVLVGASVGAYPPFLYLPIGLVARLGSTPEQAFILARLVCVVLSLAILFLGAAHIARWLGRRALIGFVLALSPMAVYTMSVVSTSGIEIAAASTVAAVVVVAIRRPDSVLLPRTHWTLAGAGGVLALSRQLGVVELAFFVVVLLASIGLLNIRQLITEHRPSFLMATGVLGVTAAASVVWELKIDKPILVGSYFDTSALRPFVDGMRHLVDSSIGIFGYLDTPLPDSVLTLWMLLWVVTLGAAVLFGSRLEATVVALGLVATLGLAFIVYAKIFYPIQAGVQGRQFLPIFSLCPILGAVVVDRALARVRPRNGARWILILAVVVPAVQLFSIYWNGRRYATGAGGALWFLPHAQWTPPLGWAFILTMSLIACVTWALIIYSYRPKVVFENRSENEGSVGPGVDGKISSGHIADL